MKKIFKSRIFIFILGVISAIGITSAFAYSIIASDVGFTPQDSEWIKQDGQPIENVEEALDDLRAEFNAQEKKLFLYWRGDTFDAVTGGWSSSMNYGTWGSGNNTGVSKKNAVFNDEYIDVSINSTYQYVVANTNNKIDCTDYEYINIYYAASSIYYAQVTVENILNPVYVTSGNERIWRSGLMASSMHIISYPITCSSPGYIAFSTLRGIASDSVTSLKVYGVYLSKNKGPAIKN